MVFGLFWIELLAIALAWVAAGLADAARAKINWRFHTVRAVVVALPLLVLSVLTLYEAFMKYNWSLENNGFAYTLALLITYIVGATAICWYGSRRPDAGLPRVAAGWRRAPLHLTLFLAVLLCVMTFWNMDLAVLTQVAHLRTEAGVIMLDLAPPRTHEAEKTAAIYEEAFERFRNDQVAMRLASGKNSVVLKEKIDANDPEASALLTRQAEYIALLKKAAASPDCRFEHNYAALSEDLLFPELAPMRNGMRLLKLHARFEVANGRPEAALDDIRAIFAMGRHVQSVPVMISLLVELAIFDNAAEVIPQTLDAMTHAEQLADFVVPSSALLGRDHHRSMRGEGALGLGMYCNMATRHIDLSNPSASFSGQGGVTLGMPEGLGALFRVFMLADSVSALRELMQSQAQLALQPYYQARSTLIETEAQWNRSPKDLLTSLIVPVLTHCAANVAKTQARLEVARVGVALTRYRLERHAFPAKLEELLPKYLNEVPLDPFDGQPLRYILKDRACVVYSIGPDLQDDHGTPFDKSGERGDIVLPLKLPGEGGERK